MLIVSIETSTPRSSVALANDHRVVASASLSLEQRHGEFIAPAIAFCLDKAGLTVRDITGVAVGIGPGLYTGLRVGIVTARSMATALRVPVVGLCGLDVLAFQLRHTRRLICVAIDARRGELFSAFYRCAPGGVQRASELRISSPQKLAAEIEGSGQEYLVVGDGAVRYREVLTGVDAAIAGVEMAWPDAADLAELAVPRFVREDTKRPEDLRPLYLRTADARIGWEVRGRLRGGSHAPGQARSQPRGR